MVVEGEGAVAVAEVVAIEMIVTAVQVKRRPTLTFLAVFEEKLVKPSILYKYLTTILQ